MLRVNYSVSHVRNNVSYVNTNVSRVKISVSHVDTESNMADILTKCMPNYKFQKQLKLIGGSQMGKHMAAFMRRIEII